MSLLEIYDGAMREFANVEVAARIANTTPYKVVYDYCRKQSLDQHDARRVTKLVLDAKNIKCAI